jgi:hypothetical protein
MQTTNQTKPARQALNHRLYCGHTAEGTPGKIPHRNVTGLYCYDCASWVATMPSTSPPFQQEPNEPPAEASFTPGPWQSSYPGVKSRENYIADCDVTYNLPTDEKRANARLIAAAPDLLAALERCLPFVDRIRALSGGDGDLTALTARAAIAAAKG